jgi:hypothetical protein
MDIVMKRLVSCLPLAIAVIFFVITPASAITANTAKKCREMAIRAYPPTPPGTKTGTTEAERDFYRACIANNGATPADDTPTIPPPAAK